MKKLIFDFPTLNFCSKWVFVSIWWYIIHDVYYYFSRVHNIVNRPWAVASVPHNYRRQPAERTIIKYIYIYTQSIEIISKNNLLSMKVKQISSSSSFIYAFTVVFYARTSLSLSLHFFIYISADRVWDLRVSRVQIQFCAILLLSCSIPAAFIYINK